MQKLNAEVTLDQGGPRWTWRFTSSAPRIPAWDCCGEDHGQVAGRSVHSLTSQLGWRGLGLRMAWAHCTEIKTTSMNLAC